MTPTFEFVLPEGSNDPCPNACGGLTEDPYGGPCKSCWANTGKGEWDDYPLQETYPESGIYE